jgi:hypothetical protein
VNIKIKYKPSQAFQIGRPSNRSDDDARGGLPSFSADDGKARNPKFTSTFRWGFAVTGNWDTFSENVISASAAKNRPILGFLHSLALFAFWQEVPAI